MKKVGRFRAETGTGHSSALKFQAETCSKQEPGGWLMSLFESYIEETWDTAAASLASPARPLVSEPQSQSCSRLVLSQKVLQTTA